MGHFTKPSEGSRSHHDDWFDCTLQEFGEPWRVQVPCVVVEVGLGTKRDHCENRTLQWVLVDNSLFWLLVLVNPDSIIVRVRGRDVLHGRFIKEHKLAQVIVLVNLGVFQPLFGLIM